MSYATLLNQTITHYPVSDYDEFGREVDGSAVTYKARMQVKRKTIMLPNGQVLQIDAVCYLPPSATVNIDDRITYNSVDYKVLGKYEGVGGSGETETLKVELMKWQT